MPNVHWDVQDHIKICVWCQNAKPLISYRTTMSIPLKNIFETYSIHLDGHFPKSKVRKNHFLSPSSMWWDGQWPPQRRTHPQKSWNYLFKRRSFPFLVPRRLLYLTMLDFLPPLHSSNLWRIIGFNEAPSLSGLCSNVKRSRWKYSAQFQDFIKEDGYRTRIRRGTMAPQRFLLLPPPTTSSRCLPVRTRIRGGIAHGSVWPRFVEKNLQKTIAS